VINDITWQQDAEGPIFIAKIYKFNRDHLQKIKNEPVFDKLGWFM
jgi:hypothetical protein